MKTVSGKVVRHSLAFCAKMVIPFYVKIWPKLTNPFKNADFQFQSIGLYSSASAVTPSEKKFN